MKTSYNRLIEAVSAQWQINGFAAMSVRHISAAAGCPVSSIYHHFGSLEHLFGESQRECLGRAAMWCQGQLEDVADRDGRLEDFAEFFAHIVDEWTEGCRPLAFAWRECELLAARSPLFVELAASWRSLWHDFWRAAGERFALGCRTFLVERLFCSESLLHMIRWRRAVDRAALSEIAHGLTAWLAGKPAPAAPWREWACGQVQDAQTKLAAQPAKDDATTNLIRTAAAELIGLSGVAGLTHRAVAERASLTLGVVSHKFRTKAALLEAAFEGLYAAMSGQDAHLRCAAEPSQPPLVTARGVETLQRDPRISGNDDLMVSAARDPSLRTFGARLRYQRGRSSRGALQALLGPGRPISLLEGAMFSGFLSAQLRQDGDRSGEDLASMNREIQQLVALLTPGVLAS